MEQGINIYGPGFCFGLFTILLNLVVLYVYKKTSAPNRFALYSLIKGE